MEDYDIINEMSNIKPIIMGIDYDNEPFWKDKVITNDSVEFMPIRLSYNMDKFSEEYIEKTNKLFIYYYDISNYYNNEILRLKKHFKHYQRFPKVVYIPNDLKFTSLRNIINEIGIKILDNEKDVIEFIKKIND